MARFRYDIVPIPQGWQVNCNGTAGSPYREMSHAVLDTLAAAEQLRKQGHRVDVRLLQLDGVSQSLETKDVRAYRRT